MSGLHHLTVDTGHTRVSQLGEIDPAVIERLRPLTVRGDHDLPAGGCNIRVTIDGTAALVTVMRQGDPLVTFGVAADAEGAAKVWPLISQNATAVPRPYPAAEPTAVPWLAARLEAGIAVHQDDADWLGDFERCWAWTWLTQQNPI